MYFQAIGVSKYKKDHQAGLIKMRMSGHPLPVMHSNCLTNDYLLPD